MATAIAMGETHLPARSCGGQGNSIALSWTLKSRLPLEGAAHSDAGLPTLVNASSHILM